MDAARALLDTLMGTDRDDGQATSAVSDDVQQSAGVVFTANRPSSENTPDPEAGDRPIDLSHKLSRLNGMDTHWHLCHGCSEATDPSSTSHRPHKCRPSQHREDWGYERTDTEPRARALWV